MDRLRGRTVLITGAPRGIGKSVVQACATEGARVAFTYLDHKESAVELVSSLHRQGYPALSYYGDVRDESRAQEIVSDVVRKWGTIDILINNAAIYPRRDWTTLNRADFDEIFGINVWGMFVYCQAVFPYMKAQHRGKIINVSSVTFWNGAKEFIDYVSTKGAVIGFTRSLARALGNYGICVNAVTPGAVLTEQELMDFPSPSQQQAIAEQMARLQCFSRREQPDDVVGTFLFLASSDSDFMTGQAINIDGGWIMH